MKGKLKNISGTVSKTAIEEIQDITSRYNEVSTNDVSVFSDLPICRQTFSGLESANYLEPTAIQKEAILVGLQGLDILGAAKTGSGKTLAFIIPVLEALWRNRWSYLDGIGALIISPTRELAFQIYECLCEVGQYHDFSAGLLIGGTDVEKEKNRRCLSNIIVCTPGRLLQHMDENPSFTCDNLQVLVLDEADRLLDMGFEKQLTAIVENLPRDRQTLMFSATQTRSVKDLARLSLTDPVFVSVHEYSKFSTPEQLQQSYIVCEEHQKLNVLWSFIKSHLHKKILVFIATCKQVRFIYESVRLLRPGTPVSALHGAMSQTKRVATYEQFLEKPNGVLFATDIAARGLDFQNIDWVLQLDCPADAHEYIHRVGRTARYDKKGEALLVLTPSQNGSMIEQLKTKKIPITKIEVNPKKLVDIHKKLESLCAQNPELKTFAQRAFVAYLRSVHMMRDKQVFDVKMILLEELSRSFGLSVSPRVRFLKKSGKSSAPASSSAVVRRSDHKAKSESLADTFEEDTFLTIKHADVFGAKSGIVTDEDDIVLPQKKRRRKRKAMSTNADLTQPLSEDEEVESDNIAGTSGINIEEARARLLKQDKTDKQTFRQRIKEKHRELKRKRKLREALQHGRQVKEDNAVVLGSSNLSDNSLSTGNENDNRDSPSDAEDFVELPSLRQQRKFISKRKKCKHVK